MEVDYLLYHEDYKNIEKMVEGLTDCPDGLFHPRWRMRQGVATSFNGQGWSDVHVRDMEKVGRNVLRYNVTLPSRYSYPALVTAQLIDKDWMVKVRYRDTDEDDPWTYMKCEFPEGTTYDLPDGWQEV